MELGRAISNYLTTCGLDVTLTFELLTSKM